MLKDTVGVITKDEKKFAQAGFFGGRTDITNSSFELTQQQVEAGWKIKYDDIVSLYPSVMWYKDMPYVCHVLYVQFAVAKLHAGISPET